MQSCKIEVEEDVIRTSMLDFLRYGEKIYISSFKKIMILTVLSGNVPGCPLIGYQTQENVYKDIW